MKKISMIIMICVLTLIVCGCNERDTGSLGAEFVVNEDVIRAPEEGLWVEVSLKEKANIVIVREGNDILREMVCSGGTTDEPTITGTYYIQNRGLWFYSERFKEGATYWVRIKDQYLFHGIPRDKDWNIIEEEREKLGKLASHGCIRFSEEDAKWFYENVPDGTMVIIHY